MDKLVLEIFDDVPEDALETIEAAILDFNREHLSLRRKLFIPLKDRDGIVDGGLIGYTGRAWLYTELLFVPEYRRGQGLAGQLLMLAEDEGRRRGCKASIVDTMNPTARRLYEKLGYETFGSLADPAESYSVTWMRKQL
ncbi:GNAT family N-acetyltransferase [Agrobacterium vitis]|uniref:GNAT family N-acetyltransferase n=1 Tax=Allorhizobium ampelinum TaxID=3025782 RepID=UPI001F475129|nr:GNAT family N-acetyltransferase [Allorhizobium ampelinum]MCF1463878.1 GNAT family N-acetyltransferase [Allorhizobium ampelinum]